MNTRSFILGGTILLLLTGSCGRKQTTEAQKAPETYPTQVTEVRDTMVYVEYPAIIRGQEDIEVKPRLEGVIDAIYVDEGAAVKKG